MVKMSTIYGISRIPNIDLSKEDYEFGENILIIGGTHDFNRIGRILMNIIPEDTSIYALDNSTQLKTFGDLISYYGYRGCKAGDHDIIPILGFENSIIGEECRQCGIKLN